MTIDLNDPADFTVDNVRRLIASGDDSTHSQLRISKPGIAFVSKTIAGNETDNLAFYLEPWIAGRGHVGEIASKDENWVRQAYEALRDNWPNPTAECIDLF